MSFLRKRKWILWLSGIFLIVVVPITIFMQIIIHSNVPALAEGSFEQHYAQQDSYDVQVEEVKAANGEDLFRIYYPAFQSNETYPIVSWGNGTDATPDRYTEIFTHLSSWGFIVIDSYS